MKFPIHPVVYDRLKELKMLPSYVIKDEFINEDLFNKKEIQMSDEKRVQHHELISELTGHLSDAVRGLENFVDEVEGHGKEQKVEVKKTAEEIGKNPSLSQFLDHYPERLETLNARVTETTNRLRGLLF